MAIDINIPSQVKNYANLSAFPATGSLKTIFIAEDTNKTYRWTGSAYVEISASQATAWGAITGTLSSQTDLNTALSGKVPTTRTLTINGTTQDLSADRTFTISTGITIGTTAITSGTVGRVLFEGTGNVVQESANLFWDNTNGRLGIGTSSPSERFHISTNAVGTNTQMLLSSSTSAVNNILFKSSDGVTQGTLLATGSAFIYGTYTQNQINVFGQSGGIGLRTTNGADAHIRFYSGNSDANFSTEKMRLVASTGNLLINITTDAGFKLDVNGTARINTLTIGLGGGQVATNTTLGFQAGNATATAGGSTYIGYQAGNKNIGGSITAIGHTSAFNNTNGDGITAIGGRALLSNTTGNYNTAVGYSSLLSNTTGSSNTAIGVDASSGNFTGSVILGRNATATANNQFVVGSSTINAGTVTTEINASTQVWNVVINGVAYKILLA